MGETVRCSRACSLSLLNMFTLVLLSVFTTVQSQTTENGTTTVMTEAPSTGPTTAAPATTPAATTSPAAPTMPVQKLVGSVSASEENGTRLVDMETEMTQLLIDAFSGSNSDLQPIFRGIEVEDVSFTVNFRLVLDKNVNASDVNGTAAAAVLLGSLSSSGMLGRFLVGTEGVYFYMPPVPEPTEAPFELPYWGPPVAISGVVVVFLILVIVAACYVRCKDDNAKLVQQEEMFDAEL